MKSIVCALALLGAATARIVGMTGPAVIAPDSKISVSLVTERTTEPIRDVVAYFSLSRHDSRAGCMGDIYLGSFFLGKDDSNDDGSLPFALTTPSDLSDAAYITGAVSSDYGSPSNTTNTRFDVPIEVGTQVSERVSADTQGFVGHCFARSSPAKRDTSCFPNSTLDSIAESQHYAQTLISDIATNNSRDGKAALGELNGHLHDVFRAVDIKQQGVDACNNPQNLTWPALPSSADDHSRATTITNAILAGLNEIEGDVKNCRTTFIFKKACAVLEFVAEVAVYPWD